MGGGRDVRGYAAQNPVLTRLRKPFADCPRQRQLESLCPDKASFMTDSYVLVDGAYTCWPASQPRLGQGSRFPCPLRAPTETPEGHQRTVGRVATPPFGLSKGFGMRQHEEEFWDQYSGIHSDAARPTTGAAAGVPGPDVEVLGIEDVARRLCLGARKVRELAAGRRLYAYRQDGKLLFPQWQLTAPGDTVIPHLHIVLATLPADVHQGTAAGFFLTVQPDLVLNGQAANAKEWLEAGGPPEPVIELAQFLTVGN